MAAVACVRCAKYELEVKALVESQPAKAAAPSACGECARKSKLIQHMLQVLDSLQLSSKQTSLFI